MSRGAFWTARRAAVPTTFAGNPEQVTGFAASCLGKGRDAVDGTDDGTDALRRSDLQPDRFGGHERSVGEEIVRDPAQPSFEGLKGSPNDPRLEFVEREPVEGVDDRTASHAVGGHPTDPSRPARMGVDEIELALM